jgi:hypothetical protein
MESPAPPIPAHAELLTRRSLLLGLLVWFVHLNLTYGLASVACVWGWFSFHVAGLSGLPLVEALITLVAAVVLAVLVVLPWRDWRAFQTDRPPENRHLLHDTEKDRRPLLAFIAMLLNSFFLLFVIASFVPILALNACGSG